VCMRGHRPHLCVLRLERAGPAAARNAGAAATTAPLLAFTDADCVPSRGWLRGLLNAVEKNPNCSGAAGAVVGMPSEHSASRFVDISGGFDVERHLSHPVFPFGPSGNVMYRAEDLRAVGGFDERFTSYEACDLNMRIKQLTNQDLVFAPSAVVLHKHRESWRAYWRQQRNYGRGLGQFYRRWSSHVEWGLRHEVAEWASILPKAAMSCLPGDDDKTLARRGNVVKAVAQRIGFASTYFSSDERARWNAPSR